MPSLKKFLTVGEGLQSVLSHTGNIVFSCTSGNGGGHGGDGAIVRDPVLLEILEQAREKLIEAQKRTEKILIESKASSR